MTAEDYKKLQALIMAAEKYREMFQTDGVVGDGFELDEAIKECKEIVWPVNLSSTEIPGSMYAPWQDITIGSGTRLVDCISKTEIEDISTPEQIWRTDEISSK